MIVSVVNTKGGVSKTTTSVFLANELALREPGREILLADLDKQGSATEWADRAHDNGEAFPFRVEVSNVKRLPRLAEQLGSEAAVFIDTPPGDSSVIQNAIEMSDFVIVPTQAAGLDLSRVWETLPVITTQMYAVLITSARLNTRLLNDTIETLEDQGISRFDTIVPLREHIRTAYGFRPPHDNAYADVLNEMLEALKDGVE
ncbi:ParA family protein [Gordonia westfalica]|uniref:ParA family protein n=1 Tax=Gordonia westfalica TaxID=158898 RepID=A0ABU2GY11_9ACTN|nr:ParA family protein [Gordonia westfalica]MDS1116348.1 ParA family protein [Gordonia westfalica]